MTGQSGMDRLEQFLAGGLDGCGTEAFLAAVRTDELLRRRLERESGLEAACGLCLWPAAEHGLAEGFWEEAVAQATGVRVRTEAEPEDARWAAELLSAPPSSAEGGTTGATARGAGRSLRRTAWALAATLALLAAGTAVVVTRAHGRRAPVQALNVPEPSATTPDIGRGPAQDAASLAAVPVVEEHRRRHSPGNGTVLVTPSRLGVVQLGAASGVLAEQGARLRTRVLPDSSLVVTLVHGEGLFSVEPGDLPGLQVSTPHVRIRVLGTVFRVSVDSVRTTVRVLQGTVRLEAGGREVVLTPDGERVSAVATDDSLLVRMVDEGALTLVRRRLLRTYLSYLANADAGPETDSAVGARVDSLEAGLLRSPPAGAVLRDAEPLLLLRTARKLVRAGRHAEAERLYERLVKEDVCGAVGQYAAYRRARILLNAYGDPAAASTAAGQALGCAQAGPIGPELATIRMAAAVRAGVADTAVPVLEGFVREHPGAPEAEWAAFQCAQFLRLERTDWKAALQYYAYVVDSFPAGRYREDATYWAGQCLAQVGAQRFENRFFGLYDSAFPEGNWRFLVGPR